MQRTNRKAAIAAYKERKVTAGIYALRCSATGQCWAGRAPDLSTIENRLRFALNHDASMRASLRAALREHGADSISFQVVETIDTEEIPYDRERFLRDRLDHWRTKLGAEAI